MSAVFTIGKSYETGFPLHVRNSKNGLACKCVCYECEQKLEAVQGQRDWYFRHSDKSSCLGSRETALHQYAKLVLYQNNFVQTRKKVINYTDPMHETVIDKYRSDVGVKYNDSDLHFEVVVHHDLHPEKKHYYQANRINCVKIDLSDPELLSALPEQIKHAVIDEEQNKIFIQWNEEGINELQKDKKPIWPWVLVAFVFIKFIMRRPCFRSTAKKRKYKW